MSWEQTIGIMKELTDLYQNSDTDDCSDVTTVTTAIAGAKNAAETLRTALAEDVGIKKAAVKEAEERMERESEGDYQQKIQELRRKEAKVGEEFGIIEETSKGYEARTAAAEQETQEEAAMLALIEKTKSEEVPRIRHAISLYANISNMKMDHSAVDGFITGTVALPDKEEVHIFEVDATALGPYEVTKEMWRVMDAGRKEGSGIGNGKDV